jgi:hypothetical protein
VGKRSYQNASLCLSEPFPPNDKKAASLTTRVTDVLRAKDLPANSAVVFGDPSFQILNEGSTGSNHGR